MDLELKQLEDKFRRHKHDGIETDKLDYNDPENIPVVETPATKLDISSIFESGSRFVQANVTGTFSFNTLGAGLVAGNGVSGGYAQLRFQPGTGLPTELNLFDNNPQMSIVVRGNNLSNGGSGFFGIGAVTNATEHTFTNKHIGFKLRAASGLPFSLTATQADGATESVSSTLTTITNDDILELIISVDDSLVTYSYRKNGGPLTTTTLTTNKPTGTGSTLQFSVSTDGYINPVGIDVLSFNYSR